MLKAPDLHRVVAHIVTPGIAGVIQHHRARSSGPVENLRLGVLIVDRERPIVGKRYAQVFVFKFLFRGVHRGSGLWRRLDLSQPELAIPESRHRRAENQFDAMIRNR